MKGNPLTFVVLFVIIFISGPLITAGVDSRVPATGAARELSRQLFFLQNTISLIPGPPAGRGLFNQCDAVQGDLIFLQQQMKRPVSREELLLNFDKMDAKLKQLLDDMKGFQQWDEPLRMVCQRVRAAEHDLHFALTGEGNPAGASQIGYRQTLALMTKSENFAGMVRYVFDEQNVLKGWNTDLAAFKQAMTEFQSLQQNKAAPEKIKNQLLATDQAWGAIVTRVKALPQGQYILLQSDAAQVDQVLFRLAKVFGINNRRSPLPDPLAF
jgi:hypothetical protein